MKAIKFAYNLFLDAIDERGVDFIENTLQGPRHTTDLENVNVVYSYKLKDGAYEAAIVKFTKGTDLYVNSDLDYLQHRAFQNPVEFREITKELYIGMSPRKEY